MIINLKYIALIITGCIFLLWIILSGSINAAIDFAPLYYSSQILSANDNIYNFDLLRDIIISHGHAYSAVHYLYPPFLTTIIQPLGQLSLAISLTAWLMLNIVSLIIGLGLLIQYFFPDKLRYYLIFLSGLLLFYPVTMNLYLGQVNPIIFLLIGAGLIMLLKNNHIKAGVFLGLASLIKIFPLIFLLHCLIIKKWKVFFTGLLTILGGVIITIILAGQAGLTNTIEYINRVLPKILSGNLIGWTPGSTAPGVLDILWTSSPYRNITNGITKIILLMFLLFIIYKYLIKKQKPKTKSIALEFSFFTTMMVITSAFSFHHYLIWLIIPFIILIKYYLERKNQLFLLGLVIAFIFSAIPPNVTKYFLPHYINDSIYPFINPGLWSVIIIIILINIQYFHKEKGG